MNLEPTLIQRQIELKSIPGNWKKQQNERTRTAQYRNQDKITHKENNVQRFPPFTKLFNKKNLDNLVKKRRVRHEIRQADSTRMLNMGNVSAKTQWFIPVVKKLAVYGHRSLLTPSSQLMRRY